MSYLVVFFSILIQVFQTASITTDMTMDAMEDSMTIKTYAESRRFGGVFVVGLFWERVLGSMCWWLGFGGLDEPSLPIRHITSALTNSAMLPSDLYLERSYIIRARYDNSIS